MVSATASARTRAADTAAPRRARRASGGDHGAPLSPQRGGPKAGARCARHRTTATSRAPRGAATRSQPLAQHRECEAREARVSATRTERSATGLPGQRIAAARRLTRLGAAGRRRIAAACRVSCPMRLMRRSAPPRPPPQQPCAPPCTPSCGLASAPLGTPCSSKPRCGTQSSS